MKKLLSIILSITMLLSSAIFVSADGTDDPKSVKKVNVAVNAEFPPFEYYKNDELKGFDIDLMNAIAEKAGFEIEYVNIQFDEIMYAIMSGRVDCGISAITVTEQREQSFDFTRPYLTAKTTNHPMESEKYEEYADYAIVFPENTCEKSNVLLAAGERSIYAEVNNAIEQFSKDGTIEKLIEKYKLNESLTDGGATVTYTVANALSATSVPYSDWAKSDIEKALSLNIINYGGNYNYLATITREEFCEIIYNYISNVLNEEMKPDEHKRIVDTDSYEVQCLVGADIIEGKSVVEISATPLEGEKPISNFYDITFAPNDTLTREEAAVILTRMVNKTVDVPVHEIYYEFEDSNDISEWADSSIQVMCNMGVMNGVAGNKFAPKDTYTTEQAIATVVRVYAAQGVSINPVEEKISLDEFGLTLILPNTWENKYAFEKSDKN